MSIVIKKRIKMVENKKLLISMIALSFLTSGCTSEQVGLGVSTVLKSIISPSSGMSGTQGYQTSQTISECSERMPPNLMDRVSVCTNKIRMQNGTKRGEVYQPYEIKQYQKIADMEREYQLKINSNK